MAVNISFGSIKVRLLLYLIALRQKRFSQLKINFYFSAPTLLTNSGAWNLPNNMFYSKIEILLNSTIGATATFQRFCLWSNSNFGWSLWNNQIQGESEILRFDNSTTCQITA